MKRDAVMTSPLESSFLSCERDTQTILQKLFIESRPYSAILKRLLVIANEDCIDESQKNNPEYLKVDKMSIKELIDGGYIILSPVAKNPEHSQLKAAMVLTFENFTPNQTNPEFRDCSVCIDVLCNVDCWELKNYQQRPFKILGYIDGILNKARLSGIGRLEFVGGTGPVINEDVGMYALMYRAVHGTDDTLPDEEYGRTPV